MLAMALAAGGCSSMQVWSEHDPRASFDDRGTYAWKIPEGADAADEGTVDPILDARVRSAVDAELVKRGFVEVDAEPDMLVAYQIGVQDRQVVTAVYDEPAYSYGYTTRTRTRRSTVYEYEEGTLSLDFVDPASGRPIWRGSARAEIDPSGSQQQRDERIAEAVRRMLDLFPPR
jgi:hypothetical protein